MNDMNDLTPIKLGWKTLVLLTQRKALLSTEGFAFYVWERGARLIVAFDPMKIDINRVNDDFAHNLSTILHGRRVERMNSRGVFLQVGYDVPPAPKPLQTLQLDLSLQPTPWHMPVGTTAGGALWISLIESDSILIGGSRGGGKTGLEHGFIQALLHGGQTLVYAWEWKRGVEFGRYVGNENFHLITNGVKGFQELEETLKARGRMLTESGYPSTVSYNEAHETKLLPIALFIDEAADLPADCKAVLEPMIRLYRYAGMYPILCTNQPTVANVFAKTNLSTRIAFRVPHHNDSITMLGYKGAESLPDVRGRGLIVWKGSFVEFQTFTVSYPMPDPAAMKQLMANQDAAEGEASASVDQGSEDGDKTAEVLALAKEGLSKTNIVYRVWGRSGSNFAERMDQVKRILLTASTATASETPDLPLHGAVA